MSNTNPPSNAWTADNNPQPVNRRGKGRKTLMLEAIFAKTTNLKTEEDVYEYVADEAFNKGNKELLDFALSRAIPEPIKSKDFYTVDYDINDPYHVRADKIFAQVANGNMPVDVGDQMISQLKTIATVYEQTEILKRLAALEEMLNQALK